MKMIILMSMFMGTSGLSVGASAFASTSTTDSAYTCKDYGNYVCAVSQRTGQCTQSWKLSDGGDPMFFCRKYTGQSTSGGVNWNNYYCKDFGGYVCAVSKIHGQCGASWSKDDGGDAMFFCKKQLGLVTSRPKAGRFHCKDMGNSVCAVSNATGQCTNSWDKRDGDAAYQCEKFINH